MDSHRARKRIERRRAPHGTLRYNALSIRSSELKRSHGSHSIPGGHWGRPYNILEQEDQTEPITGSVDPKTQRAAWFIGEDQQEITETAIANLTKDDTSVLIHSGIASQYVAFIAEGVR